MGEGRGGQGRCDPFEPPAIPRAPDALVCTRLQAAGLGSGILIIRRYWQPCAVPGEGEGLDLCLIAGARALGLKGAELSREEGAHLRVPLPARAPAVTLICILELIESSSFGPLHQAGGRLKRQGPKHREVDGLDIRVAKEGWPHPLTPSLYTLNVVVLWDDGVRLLHHHHTRSHARQGIDEECDAPERTPIQKFVRLGACVTEGLMRARGPQERQLPPVLAFQDVLQPPAEVHAGVGALARVHAEHHCAEVLL